MIQRDFVRALVVLVLCGLAANAAWAQNYPVKPVKIVVPFAAGSGTDAVARITALYDAHATAMERLGMGGEAFAERLFMDSVTIEER